MISIRAPGRLGTRRANHLDAATLERAATGDLAHARRHGRALTVLALLPAAPVDAADDARLASALAGRVRGGDVVGIDRRSNLLVVLKETTGEQAQRCAERLAHEVDAPAPLRFGAASFPDDGQSWTDVSEQAVERARGTAATEPATRPGASRSRRRRRRLRRCVDLLVVVLTGPVVLPTLGVLALAVRLSSRGPALITHVRLGEGGQRFRVYKLRTMFEDAEDRKRELAHLNVLPWPDFKIPDDPRVTPVGRWLRRSSLDELPQLWNVLRGEMTLVGPRPCSIALEQYEPWQTERLDSAPGLFGRWQAEGRGVVDFRERCRMDIRQIRGTSVTSDAQLVAKSLMALLTWKGSS